MLQAVVVLSVVCVALATDRPAFCHDLDCPEFEVLETNDNYELRHYNATKWAAIQAEGASRDQVNNDMFFTLFKYIDGSNANSVKIPMTAPVLVTMAHGQGPNCATNFTMHFMIPHDQWSNPIPPTNSNVHIVTLPPMDVYVRGFSGFAKDDDYTTQAADLYASLPKSGGVNVDTTSFYSAGYDGPYQFSHRHNEIWIRRL